MSVALPSFIIAGAPRSGTTLLYNVMDKDQTIYLAKPSKPEPKFFLVDELYEKGIDYYKTNWFDGIEKGKIIGEKSTNYMEGSSVAKRIFQHIPNIKLIFTLREPAERAFSNYLWSKLNGLETESFSNALTLETNREKNLSVKHQYSKPHAYYSRGLYYNLLKPFFSLFPRENILCLKYEDLINKPNQTIQLINRLIGSSLQSEWIKTIGIVNSSRKNNESMDDSVASLLRKKYAPENRKLQNLLGDDFQVWKQ